MSKEFYKFTIQQIQDFFIDGNEVNKGDRFYIHLDMPEEVAQLMEAFKNTDGIEIFSYNYSNNKTPFQVPMFMTKSGIKVLIAGTSKNVTPDFLAKIRNNVSLQEGEFEGTALISVLNEQLETISGGSTNLLKNDMPLNIKVVHDKLVSLVAELSIDKVHAMIFKDTLKRIYRESEMYNTSFLDFAKVYEMIQKGEIEKSAYKEFGMFYDPDLTSFKGKEVESRIANNKELFSYVSDVHSYGGEQEQLEKKFTNNIIPDLKSKEWNEVEFSKVFKDAEKFNEAQKSSKIEYDENSMKIIEGHNYWDRSINDKAASRRNRHIIIFNPNFDSNLSITIPFSLSGKLQSLNKKGLNKSYVQNLTTEENIKKKNIDLTFTIEDSQKPSYIRYTFKQGDSSTLTIKFQVLILPCESLIFEKYKTKFEVAPNKKKFICAYENDQVTLGKMNSPVKEELVLNDENPIVKIEDIEKNYVVNFDTSQFNDSGELLIKVEVNNIVIPMTLHTESIASLPIKADVISKLLREKSLNFFWNRESNRLIQGTHEYYIESTYSTFLEWENTWLEKYYFHAEADGDHLKELELDIDDRLKENYSYFIQYFINKKTISTLTYVDNEYRERAINYVKTYLTLVDEFEEEKPVLNKGIDLFKFGTIVAKDVVYLTPYHPLMVAYKLELYNMLKNEDINTNMLNRLSPDALLPLMYFDNQLYKPDNQSSLKEWQFFKPIDQVSVADANQYLAQVVQDKLKQFENHFSYLFLPQSKAPLQINVINITNDLEVVRGLINWMIERLSKKNGEKNLKILEVTIYSDGLNETAFDLLSQAQTSEEFEEMFSVKLKTNELDSDDVMNIIRNNIWFYKKEMVINDDLRYAHISFYKLETQKYYGIQNNSDMLTGISLEGIYNSVPSMKCDSMYKSGFGTKGYDIESSELLLNTAEKVNELTANIKDNGGMSGYRKKQSTVSNIGAMDYEKIKLLFKHSNWVTFIDPGVDLEFFKRVDDNLVIIHYSDQYSSSSRYDAITVTNKTKQYATVIKEYLLEKEVESTEQQITNAITTFNTFNGEWLLRIIGSNGEYGREKLSLASAIKYTLSYFEHSKIMWVPISLEEILRVVGVYHLSKNDGIFTAKNLGVSGETSDDLLLIGLEQHNGKCKLHFYPVEVKIGHNNPDVLKKATNQIEKTYKIFQDVLVNSDKESFTTKFYENFFIQLFIANAKKLQNSGLWPEKNYEINDELHSKLLKRDVEFSNSLTKYIGKGTIVSFKKDADCRSAVRDIETNIMSLNLTMNDGYSGIIKTFEELRVFIQEESSDFSKAELLNVKYNPDYVEKIVEPTKYSLSTDGTVYKQAPIQEEADSLITVNIEVENSTVSTETKVDLTTDEGPVQEQEPVQEPVQESVQESIALVKEEVINENFVIEEQKNSKKPFDLETVRVEIGEVEDQDQKVFWEYGKYGAGAITNRHLLISGASGNGKTYLMQCLLLELSKQGVSSIVVDYTDSFLKNQLDSVFVEELGERLKQRSVIKDKLPINPFKRYQEDVLGDGDYQSQSDVDIAERVKSIFSAVYKLGAQQENLIYELVLRGLNRYGDEMSLSSLRVLLEEEDSSTAGTTLSKIAPLIDRNPFVTTESIDWKEHLETEGDVFIIQLKGYTRQVQLLIVEFILWDLWYFATIHGNQNKPLSIVMDEAQNLDHREGSPSAYMLTEGRKFGISGWYATQSLSTLQNDELIRLQNAATKLYFNPPASEIPTITKFISSDKAQRDEWKERLVALQKGQCIFSGATMQNGELSPNLNVKLNISSLESRIIRFKD